MEGERNIVKRSSRQRTFGDLPPRVTIYDILSFHLFIVKETSSDKIDKKCLFGYFRRDRMRNIWFVFTSLYFHYLEERKIFVDLSKVFHLRLELDIVNSVDFVKNVFCTSSQDMFSLRRIEIYLQRSVPRGLENEETEYDIEKSILEYSKFPKLESFSFCDGIIDDVRKEGENFHEYPSFFTGLKFLELFDLSNVKFFSMDVHKFRSIEKLILYDVVLSNFVEVLIPKLKTLKLSHCENLCIFPGNDGINHLTINDKYLKKKELRTIFEKSHNLRTIDISFLEGDCWIFDPIFPFLRSGSLQKLVIDTEQVTNEQIETFKNYIPKLVSLEFFELYYGNNFPLILNQHFPSLRNLVLCGIDVERDLQFPFSDQLRYFKHDNLWVQDRVFEENTFQTLEKLIIVDSNDMTGVGWKSYEFPNLKKLSLQNIQKFQDTFFHLFSGKNLKELKLEEIGTSYYSQPKPEQKHPTVRGIDWNPVLCMNLEKLSFHYCCYLEDSLFQVQEFRNLKRLKITGFHQVEEKGWLEMKKLEERVVRREKKRRIRFV